MSTDPFEYRNRPELGLNAFAMDRISNRLRSAYDEVAHDPVPDRFADLLEQLERAESAANGHAVGNGHAPDDEAADSEDQRS